MYNTGPGASIRSDLNRNHIHAKSIHFQGPTLPTGSGKVLLAVRIAFLDRVQNLQIHVVRANQYICIFSQFSEFRIQNMHSTLYVYFQSIFRNILPVLHILMHVSESGLKIHILV